jgi:hypothetical protein
MMDTFHRSKPPPRPTTAAEAETAAAQAQIVEAGAVQKDMTDETVIADENGGKMSKKAPNNGLKNYFVSTLRSDTRKSLTLAC